MTCLEQFETINFRIELTGDANGSEGAKSFFLGRAVVMNGNVAENRHSAMSMFSDLDGKMTVNVEEGDKELRFVVAAVPEYFKSHQTYSYQVKITESPENTETTTENTETKSM